MTEPCDRYGCDNTADVHTQHAYLCPACAQQADELGIQWTAPDHLLTRRENQYTIALIDRLTLERMVNA